MTQPTDKEAVQFARAHDHTSASNDGCQFCIAVEGIEAFNPEYAGVPLAERRVNELKKLELARSAA